MSSCCWSAISARDLASLDSRLMSMRPSAVWVLALAAPSIAAIHVLWTSPESAVNWGSTYGVYGGGAMSVPSPRGVGGLLMLNCRRPSFERTDE